MADKPTVRWFCTATVWRRSSPPRIPISIRSLLSPPAASSPSDLPHPKKGKNAADWLDQLVGAILEIATLGSAVSSRLHLSIVLSYKESSDRTRTSLVEEMNSDLGLLRPRQSYTMKNGKPLDEIR
ncbi:hypothetical protein FCM35_KLT18124 [Carex littledalei]|uniref:Uncharacterized protein n=1 Tax=Carex littledalei TaxID=544730 RepID=A0A833RER9_9POAL|nr:hypothetical protein FCM35_KLT18124 [Carex littledalei]